MVPGPLLSNHPLNQKQLSAEQQAAAGDNPASIRGSVGYEDIDDIKADFEQALAAYEVK